MEMEGRFATKLHSLEETPQPFRAALLNRLDPQDFVRLLAFNPSHGSQGSRSPATLLALTDHRWLLISDDDYGRAAVVESALNDTLLVELEEFLLDGRLRIDYAAGGTAHSCTIEFNTVSDQPYHEAVHLILQGVEGDPAAASTDRSATAPVIGMRPIIFHNAVPAILAEGRRPVAGVQWSSVHGWYAHRAGACGCSPDYQSRTRPHFGEEGENAPTPAIPGRIHRDVRSAGTAGKVRLPPTRMVSHLGPGNARHVTAGGLSRSSFPRSRKRR